MEEGFLQGVVNWLLGPEPITEKRPGHLWSRCVFLRALVLFRALVSVAGAVSVDKSDGMLLAAEFIALFFAPAGLRPGWGAENLPSRASLFLLQWEWFRIYFESGVAKIASGDPAWQQFTAMED